MLHLPFSWLPTGCCSPLSFNTAIKDEYSLFLSNVYSCQRATEAAFKLHKATLY